MHSGDRRTIARLTRREAILGFAQAGIAASLAFDGAMAAQTAHARLPFDLQPVPRSNKVVLAHWHYFPISIDNRPSESDYYSRHYLAPEGEGGKFEYCGGYFRERPMPRATISGADWAQQDLRADIKLASGIGIDAFQYNFSNLDPASNGWRRLIDFLQACRVSGGSFRIMPCIDCTGSDPASIEAGLQKSLLSILDHDRLFRDRQSRIVLSFFLPDRLDTATWSRIARMLRKSGSRVSPFFIFLDWQQALNRRDLLNMADYVSIWSGDHRDSLESLDKVARVVKGFGKQWVAPVWPQNFRPKDGTFVEARNSELFREAWRRIIDNDYEFVNLLTWNDYSEGSELRPSTLIQYSFYDLAAYYIQRLKAGAAPAIVRDVIYYFHRVNIAGKASLRKQAQPFKTAYGPRSTDDIEAVVFLAEAGQIEIETGGKTTRFEAKAGLAAFRTRARIGRPTFRLIRNGMTVLSVTSDFDIVDVSDYQNLLYHGGSSDRANP
jgi:hypothetical protein